MGCDRGSGRGAGLSGGGLPSEVCAPLLLLCWLCCWPDDAKSDSSSSGKSRNPVSQDSGGHRRASDFFSKRIGIATSAVSLHLPSTSGQTKQPLSAHRSNEEIPRRRKSHHETNEVETRYHSAPSVIDEVLHRRDWEKSTKDLHIPLKPDSDHYQSDLSLSPENAPKAEPELSSPEMKNEEPTKLCKKHYTNIKSSRGKKYKECIDDDKDTDATETSNFYIGDSNEVTSLLTRTPADDFDYDKLFSDERSKSVYKAKEAKQSFNESIRSKDRPKQSLVPLEEYKTSKVYSFWLKDDIDQIDRSGAVHHTVESRMSVGRPYPLPSVEVVGYEGGACYLAEVGSVSELRDRPVVATSGSGAMRARHASDGDILAPLQRPESGAFSESDLDLELEENEQRPPAYHELQLRTAEGKETAI